MESTHQQKQISKRSLVKMLVALAVFVAVGAGYFIYNMLWVSASLSGNKFLTANGSAVNTASVAAGTFTNTQATTSNNQYLTLMESADLTNGLSWNFTGWNQLNTVTESTGAKVTYIQVLGEWAAGNNTFASSGSKTFQFKLYNYSNSFYDLASATAPVTIASNTDTAFTFTFPVGDYTNYFDVNGNFQLQMENTADGDAIPTYLRIDHIYVRIYYDKTAPVTTWSSPSGNPTPFRTSAGSINLQAAATDNSDAEQTGSSSMNFYHGAGTLIGSDIVPDSGTVTNGAWSYLWSPAEGTYSVYAQAVDGKNNISANTVVQTIYVDRTAPAISVEYYADAALTQPLQTVGGRVYARGGATVYVKLVPNETLRNNAGDNQITINAPGTVNDVTGANFTWTGSAWRYNWTVNSGNDGETTSITVRGTDLIGHTKVASGGKVYIDSVQPTLSLEYYQDANLVNPLLTFLGRPVAKAGIVYVRLVANEALSAVAGSHILTIDAPGAANDLTNQNFIWDEVNNAWKYAWNVTGGNDGNTISMSVTGIDSAGNTRTGAPSAGGAATIDTVLPAASITAPVAGALIKGNVTVTGTATDSATFDYYKLEYAPAGTGTWTQIGANQTTAVSAATLISWNTTGLPDGFYDLRLTVYDKALNTRIATVTNLNVDNIAPVLSLQYFADAALTQPLLTVGGKPVTKAGTVYIKMDASETLRNNAGDNQITINAPGTANDVTNVNFTWTGSAWRYAWNVAAGAGNDGEVLSITARGTSLSGNVTSGAPVSGGTVIIDNAILTPILSYFIGSGQLTLDWSTEPDHHKYYIHRSTVNGFVPDGTSLLDTVYAPRDSYSTAFIPGTYYYRVIAEDKAGNISAPSQQVKVYQGDVPAGAYVRYANNGANVAINVYWNDNGGSTVHWANDVIPSGAKLNWQTSGLIISGLETTNAVAVLSNAEKYKNYYFRITKGGKPFIIRAYPSEFDSLLGPRYQNDNAHGNYSPDTSMCAGCHVAHSGLKAYLLKQSTYYDLCLFCHGTAATQSKYDVQSGKVKTAAGWKNSPAGPIGSDFGISKHNVDDRSNVDTTVYGSAPGKLLTFTCVTCHKPHAGDNDNYRLIRETIYPANDKFVATNVYYTAYAIVKDQAVGEEVYMVAGNTEFCTACHLDYDDGSAWHTDGTYASNYRHPVTVGSRVYSVFRSNPYRDWYPKHPLTGETLPLQVYADGESIGPDKRSAVVCSTCHYAHGTYKNFNMGYPQPGGMPRVNVANQKMLRQDNYAVCETCHKK